MAYLAVYGQPRVRVGRVMVEMAGSQDDPIETVAFAYLQRAILDATAHTAPSR
jgi:hypothetical protein